VRMTMNGTDMRGQASGRWLSEGLIASGYYTARHLPPVQV